MAALGTNVIPLQGLRFDTLLAPATLAGDTCATGAGVLLVFQNTGTAKTVTLATPETVDSDLAVGDRSVVVAATTGLTVIPVTDRYRNAGTGRAAITYSPDVTGLTVCVIRGSVS